MTPLRLAEYLAVAAAVLDTDEERASRACKHALAESALAAPFAGFGAEDQYPAPEEKVAILIDRLVRNHPLPDGNKRAAFVAGVLFARRLGLLWGPQDVERDAGMVERLAAGDASFPEAVAWVRERTRR